MTSTTLPRSEIGDLSAVDIGNGPPVLLLHGVGLQADAWAPQIEAFRGSHRVIAPDMPGHGKSVCPSAPMMLSDYVGATAKLLKDLSEPALVLGHSMGAMIALELAVRMPDSVRGVVALNAIFERSPEAAASVRERADRLDGVTTPDPTSTLVRWFGTTQSPERTACEVWLRAVDPLGYKRAYTAFAYADGPSRKALSAMVCPALFATGALEPNSTPDMSKEMAELVPNGQALVVEGAAHMMPITHAEALNAKLMEFALQVRS